MRLEAIGSPWSPGYLHLRAGPTYSYKVKSCGSCLLLSCYLQISSTIKICKSDPLLNLETNQYGEVFECGGCV